MDDLFLDEPDFNAAFGKRLMETRTNMKMSRPALAFSLGITKDQLKRYETRPSAGFPLYLLPQLIRITGKPYSFWIGPPPARKSHLAVVRSR